MTTHLRSFDLVGRKEDVSDYISLLTPSDTPFLSSIKTEKIKNTLYQWQEDQLRAVASNARIEGADFTDSTRDQPIMRSNGTQILTETFRVSGTADAMATYGRDKISAREMMKTGKLLKMDLEFSLVGTGQAYVVGTAGVAGTFAGVQSQIAPAVTITTDADTGTAGNQAGPITEANIVNAHELLYNAGSDASILMVKPSDTRRISAFQQASGRTTMVDNGDKKLTAVINIYESPFGTLRVVMNRRIRVQDALLYDPKNWKLAVYRNWFTEKLAKVADADRWAMVGEFGLKHANRSASALVTNLTA